MQKMNNCLTMVSASVLFGAPHRNCLGHGICQIYPVHPSISQKVCNLPPTRVVLFKTKDAKVGMLISVSNISSPVFKHQLSGPNFQMEEAFNIPAFLSENLGLPKKTVLAPGAHAIRRYAQCIVIHFPCI
jgi:hypothetical protein